MQTSDKIEVEILADGTLKVSTDRISQPNHLIAEKFLLDMGRLAGGEITRRGKKGVSHAHSHEGEFHKH